MLYEVSRLVETELQSRGCPIPVVYGPERAEDLALVRSRIVFERPRAGGDVVGPPRVSKTNPPRRAERGVQGIVRVFAHSTVAGARVQDHEEIAEQAVDLVIVSLQIAAAKMETTFGIGGGGYLSASVLGLDGLTTWPGVVYELTITLQRGVFDRTWVGAGKGTSEITGVAVVGTCVGTFVPPPDP